MGRQFDLKPKKVEKVRTKYRRIVTPIPAPESLATLRRLRKYEPISMTGQPPIVWDRAAGVNVYDGYGNRWLDWSSGVLVTNAGHGNGKIRNAIIRQAKHGLIHNYCFPSELRARLAERLVKLAPKPLDKCFLLTTGAETTENAIKLAMTYGRLVGGKKKAVFVTFERAFHGRTLGAQLAGGIPALKSWIPYKDPSFVNVPFPDGYFCRDTSFRLFEKSLRKQGVNPANVCGVMTETYQGGTASFAPVTYMKKLRRWCDKHKALLIFDEIQAAFGRCGKMFGFEHYGVVPDIAVFGKGISSGLPISAVLGRTEVMDTYGPGAMTSTHTGNPVCCAAALANIDEITGKKLHRNAATVGNVLHKGLAEIKKKYPDVIGAVRGKGLVAGVMIRRGARDNTPDGDLAFNIVRTCMEKGLLMFAPVGPDGGTVKIAPPLVSTKSAILEGLQVLGEAIAEALEHRDD